MHPRLFEIPFGSSPTVSTYGLLVAVGIMLGIGLGYRQARRLGIRPDDYLDLSLFGIVAALLGSRLMFVLTNRDRFAAQPWRALYLWEGGLVFYGGVVAALLTGLYFTWRRGLPYLRTADVYAPVLSLGHAFGRMGCHFAGCCWGKACAGSGGVRFPAESLAYEEMVGRGEAVDAVARTTLPLFPVQLYEAGGELLIFGLLMWRSAGKRFDGAVICTYLFLYGLLRLVTELFRGDAARRFLVEWQTPGLARALGLPPGEPLFLSTSQFVALLMVAGAAAGYVYLARRAARSTP